MRSPRGDDVKKPDTYKSEALQGQYHPSHALYVDELLSAGFDPCDDGVAGALVWLPTQG